MSDLLLERATPRPWRLYRGCIHPCFDHPSPQGTNGDTIICELLGPDKVANGRLIVRAVNAHEDLLKACEMALERLREFEFMSLSSPNTIPALVAAIAKAEGKTP